MAKTTDLPEGVVIRGEVKSGYEALLSAEALAFVAGLERKFGAERQAPARPSRGAPGPGSMPAGSPISSPRPRRSATANGRVAPIPPTCWTAASRSPARSTAR